MDDKEAILNFFQVVIDINRVPSVAKLFKATEESVMIKILEIMFLKKR